MPTLTDLDPVRDPAREFDPASPEARAVLTRALARGAQPSPPVARTRRRRPAAIAVAGGVALAAIGGTVGLVGSGGPSPLAPGEALAQAAERTARFDSGRIVWSGWSTGPAGFRAESVNDVRFDGDRVLITSRTDERLRDGSHRLAQGDYLQIGRRHWTRAPGGDWREQPPIQQPGEFAERVRGEVGDDRLVALVRAADDVRREDDGALRAAIGHDELEEFARGGGPAPDLAAAIPPVAPGETVDISVRLDGEGRISRLVLRTGRVERVIEYSQLGTPQPIEAP